VLGAVAVTSVVVLVKAEAIVVAVVMTIAGAFCSLERNGIVAAIAIV
jgi:hypothetical protein